MLICAAASLVLIVAATLVMDWYRVAFDVGVDEVSRVAIAIDLRTLRTCTAVRVCTTAPLSPLPGMFPTLAVVTLWSSLGFAALVGFQAGIRVLTGNVNDAVAKLGYMFALTTISIAVATAYLFGPETEGPSIQLAANMGLQLHRTWAPLTLIIGLIAGFATLYMSVAPDASDDLGDTYRPVTVVNLRAPGERPPATERPATAERLATQSTQIPAAARAATRPLRPSGRIGTIPPSGEASPARAGEPLPQAFQEIAARSNEQTQPAISGAGPRSNVQTHPSGPVARTTGAMGAQRPVTGQSGPARRATTGPGSSQRPVTGQYPVPRRPMPERTTGQIPAPATTGRVPVIGPATITSQVPLIEPTPTGLGERAKSGLIPVPEHLRKRLSYVAITAELTGGGIDARLEDGTSRLVLWRDVVGVVVRRMPPVFDNALFVDIVSTARSTLRVVPWTRLTGDPIEGEGDARPVRIVHYILAKCPSAKLDPATRQFLDSGEPAQLPDLETLRAHDARLA